MAIRTKIMMYDLKVKSLSEWIIGTYLHEFIVSEPLQVNPDNSRAMT